MHVKKSQSAIKADISVGDALRALNLLKVEGHNRTIGSSNLNSTVSDRKTNHGQVSGWHSSSQSRRSVPCILLSQTSTTGVLGRSLAYLLILRNAGRGTEILQVFAAHVASVMRDKQAAISFREHLIVCQ